MIPSKLHPLANPSNSAETRKAIIQFLMRVWGDYHPSEYTFVGTMNDNGLWKDHTIRGDRKNKIATILENYPADRYNLYFCPNSFSKQERKTIFANRTRYAWCDIDDNSVANYDPQPHILWQTSPGRHQGLWIWDQVYPGDVAEQYSRNIVTKDGGDRGGWSVTKMLRIPGTRNLKPKYDRPWVKLLSFSAAQQRLPTSLAEIRPIAPKAAIIGSADLTGLDSKEIIQRYRKHLELRARTLTMATRAIYPDRSDAIFIIVSAFVLAGATDAEIVCVILANPHFLEKHGDNQPMAEREVVTIRAKVEAGR